jgi:hypothetical protein
MPVGPVTERELSWEAINVRFEKASQASAAKPEAEVAVREDVP